MDFTCYNIVVTGIGHYSAVSRSNNDLNEALYKGLSGINKIIHFNTSGHRRGNAASLDYSPSPLKSHDDIYGRCFNYVLSAIKNALHDARATLDNKRVGLFLGTYLGEIGAIISFSGEKSKRPEEILLSQLTEDVARSLKIYGLQITLLNACASGLMAIGLGKELLLAGEIDLAIVGGYEFIGDFVFAGMNAIRALGNTIKPFDVSREGTVLGEGVGILILEPLCRVDENKRNVYAELSGFGVSLDNYHILRPHPEGLGAERAIRMSLWDARLHPGDISYINAHGTATRLNDNAEINALTKVFGNDLTSKPICSIKPIVGHTLGASGVFSVISSILSIKNQFVPVTLNCSEPDFENLIFSSGKPIEMQVRHVLCNSFGFGGSNACIIISAYPHGDKINKSPQKVSIVNGTDNQNVDPSFSINTNSQITDNYKLHLQNGEIASILNEYNDEIGIIINSPANYKQIANSYLDDILERGAIFSSPELFTYSFPGSALGILSIIYPHAVFGVSMCNGQNNPAVLKAFARLTKVKKLLMLNSDINSYALLNVEKELG
jgi:3-oxoacyl-[acyl-carrier-protein] synthase II